MKVLSIDVGIKNLAFCLFVKPADATGFQIAKWDSINLSQKNDLKCCESIFEKNGVKGKAIFEKNGVKGKAIFEKNGVKGKAIFEKNGVKGKGKAILEKDGMTSICNKPAKFSKNGECYCLKHCKNKPFQVPPADLKPGFINKQKIKKLHEIAEKYNIIYDKNTTKKADLVTLINKYIFEKCFDPVTEINASKVDLITVGRNIKLKLDEILNEHIDTITHVVIENQISPIANRMKTIQGMLAQYFIMRNDTISIEFVSAANKLKEQDSTLKSSYSERKKLGVQQCIEHISNNANYASWETFFKGHSKKDDLADSFLQGLWFITSKLF